MGEMRRRREARKAINQIGGRLLLETSTQVQGAFGDEFETVTAIFVRRKDDPGRAFYFGGMEIPHLANLIGEMLRGFMKSRGLPG
jgi:hypothetical protein